MAINNALSEGGETFVPSLAKAADASILKTRPEIVGARAQVSLDEKKIYQTLAAELLRESIAQRTLADRQGITLPADAGANAIEKIKAKYFSKMDQFQLVDSFIEITKRISERRRTDPSYAPSTQYSWGSSMQYRMDTYWLKGLLQRMQDTRYIDDPQGRAESEILADVAAATGGDAGEYADYLKSYRTSDRGRAAQVNSGHNRAMDLDKIIGNGIKRDAFKAVLSKIGLDASLLDSNISPADIADLLVKIDRELNSYDLTPVGITADELKAFISGLPSADSRVRNDLKSIVS